MTNEESLRKTLEASSLHVLLMLLTSALSRSGFGDVQVLDRRESWQKSRLKGCELLCTTTVGTTSQTIIIKLVKDFARTRMMDELMGASDRLSADFAILVTPQKIGPKMAATRDRYKKSRLELLDGALLAQMLMKFRIGVRPNGDVDYAYFAELHEQSDRILEFVRERRYER